MLSQQDFNVLESMMTRVVGTAIKENNEEMKLYIDDRFEKNNEEMKLYIDDRFEKNNEEMKLYIDDRFEKNNEEMKLYIDGRFEKNNEEMKSFVREHVKESVTASESFLLDEIDRFYQYTKADIQKLSDKVDEIAEYYRIRKTEDNMYNYVIHLYHKQQEEIDEIKQVLAM